MAIVDTDLTSNTSISEKMFTMLEAAKHAEADLRQTFDWVSANVLDIPCVGGPKFSGKVLDIGGWRKTRKVKIKVRLDALPDFGRTERPAENNLIVYRDSADDAGTRYTIVGVKVWAGVLMELECEDARQ